MPTDTLKPFKHQTKTQALSAYLADMATRLGPDARLPTMHQLCDSLNVSVVTLNRALSELEAQNVIYRKHGVGIFVSPRINQSTIGLVYDHDVFQAAESPFGGLLVEAARQRAASKNEKFSFYLAIPSKEGLPVHDDLVEDIRARRLDGLLFAAERNPQAVEWLLRQRVPLVALAYHPVAPHRVKLDHAASVRLGVQGLVAQGCRRIALWIPQGVGIGRASGARSFEELDAFRAALQRHGLAYHKDLVWELDRLTSDLPATAETKQDQGRRAAQEVFGEGAKGRGRPDGVVILDDIVTRGALVALSQAGLRPGTDLQIASHTNRGSAVLHGYEAELTLMEFDPAEVVQAMFSLLETLLQGREPESPTVLIEPHLRMRGE